MKFRLFVPACAMLALAACGSSTDEELSDEALSVEDVVAKAADMDLSLVPGQYSSNVELLEFDLPGMPQEVKQLAEQAFAEGNAEAGLSCISEEMTAEEWISELNESDCAVSELAESGNSFTAVMQCTDTEGMNGRVELTGTVEGESMQMEARFNQTVPGMGDAKMHIRIKGNRVGDC